MLPQPPFQKLCLHIVPQPVLGRTQGVGVDPIKKINKDKNKGHDMDTTET